MEQIYLEKQLEWLNFKFGLINDAPFNDKEFSLKFLKIYHRVSKGLGI